MRTFFIEYERLVQQAYEQMKVNNTLPYGLKHLTPAKLKDECVMRCRKNLSKRDEKVIRDFCGDLNESKTCLTIIQQCDTDKFRPLVNFLKRKSESTEPKNIELLAWLIDFPGRPWEMGKTYSEINENLGLNEAEPVADRLSPEANSSGNLPIKETDNAAGNPAIHENPIIPLAFDGSNEKERGNAGAAVTNNQEKKGKSTKRLAAVVLLSLAIGTGGTWWWKDKNRLPAPGGCMYWNEDHYEPIACNKKIPNVRIIALDTLKLKNFKKISMPDTITYLSKGKVWYSKINGKIEFFTAGGEHPVAFGHQLKPITNYMIDKYIRTGMVTQ